MSGSTVHKFTWGSIFYETYLSLPNHMVITYILSSWVLIGYCQIGRFLHWKYVIQEKMIYVSVDMEEIMYSFLNGRLENCEQFK
jgi:hypothetical protein